MSGPTERTALYRMFDDDGALLYIGVAAVFGKRWTEHAHSQSWWGEVRRQMVEWYPDRDSAEDAEEEAIGAEHPRYNITHNQEKAGRRNFPQGPRVLEARVVHGELLRKLRRKSRISQAEVAAQMRAMDWHWYQNTVHKVEHGERGLEFLEAIDLATLYGVSLAEFTEMCEREAAA